MKYLGPMNNFGIYTKLFTGSESTLYFEVTMKYLFAFIFLTQFCSFAQEFQITNTPYRNSNPVIDPFTKLIYYFEDGTGKIREVNPDGSGNVISMFPTLPIFSKKEHKTFFLEYDPSFGSRLVEYNYNTADTLILIHGLNHFSLSPNETKILLKNEAPKYYSFNDSTLHDPGLRVQSEKIEFLNDSTLIYFESNRKYLFQYTYNNNSVDTLVRLPYYGDIIDFACNTKLGCFAYSHFFNNGDDLGINLYFPFNSLDSMVFDFRRDDPELAGLTIILTDLEWSAQFDKLAFLGNLLTPYISEVYVYHMLSDTTIRFTEFGVTDDGSKANISWCWKDTLIYDCKKTGELSQIYGYHLNKPLPIVDKNINFPNHSFLINNYPNPFNNSTTLYFQLPTSGETKIFIYNITGQLIDVINLGFKYAGLNKWRWYVPQVNYNYISSGVYFCRVLHKSNNSNYQSNIIKIIYLK